MVTTLYLVRHGETDGSETNRYKGSIDVPMSERGVEQIRKASLFIAKKVNGASLSAVYCSPLGRAIKSAEIIAEPYGLKPMIIPDLRERNFGIWEGMSFDEIKEKYPVEFKAWADNPVRYSPIDGESTIEVRDRVINALNVILNNHTKDRNGLKDITRQSSLGNSIAIAAHGGVNRVILCHIMGIPLEKIFIIEQDFAAVNVIEFREEYPVVKLLNGRVADN